MNDREQFEAWQRGPDGNCRGSMLPKRDNGDYRDTCTQSDWRVWQAARATPAQPDAYEQRAMRIGKHVLGFATRGGWKDDGEGAFEYIQRHSYAVGYEDAGGKIDQFGTHPVNRWPISAIVSGAQPSPSSVGAAIRKLPLPDTVVMAGCHGDIEVYTPDQMRAILSEAAALAEQMQGQQVPELVSIDDMCAILKDMLIEADEYTDSNIVYKVTFDQLRALYMKGMAATPSIAQDGQKPEAK